MILFSNKHKTITLYPYIKSFHKWAHPQFTRLELGKEENEHPGSEFGHFPVCKSVASLYEGPSLSLPPSSNIS